MNLIFAIMLFPQIGIAAYTEYTQKYLDSWKEFAQAKEALATDKEIQKDLDSLIASIKSGKELNKKVNYAKLSEADSFLISQNRNEQDAIIKKILEKYPVIVLSNDLDKLLSKSKVTNKQLADSIKLTVGIDNNKCLPSGQVNVKDKRCLEELITFCGAKFDSLEKKLTYVKFLDENLDVKQINVNSFESYSEAIDEIPGSKEKLPASAVMSFKIIYYYPCLAASESGIDYRFKGAYYFKDYKTPEWIHDFSFYPAAPIRDNIHKKCLGAPSAEIFDKFVRLVEQEKAGSTDPKTLKKAKVDCNKLSTTYCSDIYFEKGTGVLSYETKGCEVRNVTVSDIEKDVENWKNSGMTEADILNHEDLKYRIQTCQKMNEYGFYSGYQPIKLTCKKPTK